MGKRFLLSMTVVMAAFVFAVGFMVAAPLAEAQTTASTPSPLEDEAEAAIDQHPAHIHAGTCDELGDVVYPLNNLQAAVSVASPEPSPNPAAIATPDANVRDAVAQSSTEVDVALDELLSGQYAINVHESPENIQNYLACGEITGSPTNGELTIELQELNNSGFEGVARLTDNGDGTTIVHVSLFPSDVAVTGTPAATPSD